MRKIVVNKRYKNDPDKPANPVPEVQADKHEFPNNDE